MPRSSTSSSPLTGAGPDTAPLGPRGVSPRPALARSESNGPPCASLLPSPRFAGATAKDRRTPSAGTSALADPIAGSFRIVVAARVRPFDENEVRHWQQRAWPQHRQKGTFSLPLSAGEKGAANAVGAAGVSGAGGKGSGCVAQARAVRATIRRARHHQRQPFGVSQRAGHDADDDLLAARTLGRDAEAILANHLTGNGSGGDGEDSEPVPVVDVEADRKTLTLFDPANPGVARGAFTFDYVFSSLAPTVELTLPGGVKDGTGGGYGNGGGASITGGPRARENGTSGFASSNASASTGAAAVTNADTAMSPTQAARASEEQADIFDCLGRPLLESALRGYNACIFAYGQTSSGKTYTMLGTRAQWGLTPRLLHALFTRLGSGRGDTCGDVDGCGDGGDEHDTGAIRRGTSASPSFSMSHTLGSNPETDPLNSGVITADRPGVTITVDVAFMEIYNEHVRDLLKQRPKNAILYYKSRFDAKDVDYSEYQALRVRQHPEQGITVEGLTCVRVQSWQECEKHLRQGSQLRTQAATSMNATSSRSHAIFQVTITRTENLGGRVRGRAVTSQRVSKINLVDLAGSERNSAAATSTNRRAHHVQEANSINVSLSTLRRVIDALVANSGNTSNSGGHHTGKGKSDKPLAVVPYRESLLTYVLSDNFGGNSKTVMIANVSPSASNLNETESTLRYATLARGVRNRVKVNEDPSARVIHELQHRLAALQEELALAPTPHHIAELELDLEEREAALLQLRTTNAELGGVLKTKMEREAELVAALAERQRAEEQWRHQAESERREKDRLRERLRIVEEAVKAAKAVAAVSTSAPSRGKAHPLPGLNGEEENGHNEEKYGIEDVDADDVPFRSHSEPAPTTPTSKEAAAASPSKCLRGRSVSVSQSRGTGGNNSNEQRPRKPSRGHRGAAPTPSARSRSSLKSASSLHDGVRLKRGGGEGRRRSLGGGNGAPATSPRKSAPPSSTSPVAVKRKGRSSRPGSDALAGLLPHPPTRVATTSSTSFSASTASGERGVDSDNGSDGRRGAARRPQTKRGESAEQTAGARRRRGSVSRALPSDARRESIGGAGGSDSLPPVHSSPRNGGGGGKQVKRGAAASPLSLMHARMHKEAQARPQTPPQRLMLPPVLGNTIAVDYDFDDESNPSEIARDEREAVKGLVAARSAMAAAVKPSPPTATPTPPHCASSSPLPQAPHGTTSRAHHRGNGRSGSAATAAPRRESSHHDDLAAYEVHCGVVGGQNEAGVGEDSRGDSERQGRSSGLAATAATNPKPGAAALAGGALDGGYGTEPREHRHRNMNTEERSRGPQSFGSGGGAAATALATASGAVVASVKRLSGRDSRAASPPSQTFNTETYLNRSGVEL